MNNESTVLLKDQKEKKTLPDEVFNLEKQLWALIHSKGLLQSDVQDLYKKACSSYERIILSDLELARLQDVEYSLWKLHYKHIDEFRKQTRRTSTSTENTKSTRLQNVAWRSSENYNEGFRSFLLEATTFYQNLIMKLKICYGLPGDPFFSAKGGIYGLVVPANMHKCRFLCHRFLICLGDLARYKELHEKSDIRNGKWSVAAANYFKATMLWPDGGNPQNQLALLATYIGDEFLALYHCIRSLAVEEPFPDAWDNLVLLFEKNRASSLPSLSSEVCFDFSRPSSRTVRQKKLQTSDTAPNGKSLKDNEHLCSPETNLCSLFVRMISSFFTKSSKEDFPCIFASTMAELETLLDMDDAKLKASLESYRHMDSARIGPFKSLQLVSILIFMIKNLTQGTGKKEPKAEKDMHKQGLTQLALTVTFICMGRLIHRCLRSDRIDSCPLLPAVLVFLDWLVRMLDEVETPGAEEKSTKALSYFMGGLVHLLNQISNETGEVKSPNHTALWEDFELQGFSPLADAHASLDFSSNWENRNNFENGKECRAVRIIHAARKIAKISVSSQKWMLWDESERKFQLAESGNSADKSDLEIAMPITGADTKDPHQNDCESTNECEKNNQGENQGSSTVLGKAVVGEEEEEVILFMPLTRHNSAPPCAFITPNCTTSAEGLVDQLGPPDECLRRATSLLIAQYQDRNNPLSLTPNISNFRGDKSFMQPEPFSEDFLSHPFPQTSISAGHPSLNAWVVNEGIPNTAREKKLSNNSKHVLSPIEEIASTPSGDLSKYSVTSYSDIPATTHYSSPYSTPVPSAPLLPEDAIWFGGISSNLPQSRSSDSINKKDNFLDTSQVSEYSNWTANPRLPSFSPSLTGFKDGYLPLSGITSSSEWLRQYRENIHLKRANGPVLPLPFSPPATLGNLNDPDASRFGLFKQVGNAVSSNSPIHLERQPLNSGFPLPYGVDDLRMDNLFYNNYQWPSPYGYADTRDQRGGQMQLLQYLKEKEWQLHSPPQMRGPTYTGN